MSNMFLKSEFLVVYANLTPLDARGAGLTDAQI